MKKLVGLLILIAGFLKFADAQNATCGSCYQPGINLATNGSFINSNTGFTTNLTYAASGSSSPGKYAVRPVSSTFWLGGCSIFDHTSGGGTEILCIDGKTNGLTIAWDQTISGLAANQNYILSFYSRFGNCVFSGAAPTIEVLINGVQVGDTFNIRAGTWRKVSFLWNSGNASGAVIQIVDTVQNGTGNDFILDDISFSACGPTTNVNAGSDKITCAGTPVALNSTGSGSGTCSWSGPVGLNNTATCNPVFNSSIPGDYDYIVNYTSSGCTVSDSLNIHVNALPPVPTLYQFGDTLFSTFATGYQWYSSGVALSGATGPYILPSQTGYYHIAISDPKGCGVVSDSILFTACSQLIQIQAGSDKSICSGDQVNLSATGNGSGSCVWSGPTGLTGYSGCATTFTGSSAGQFTYMVTDTLMGCSATDTIHVLVHALPSIPVISRNGDSLISTTASGYQWYSGGSLLSGMTTQYILPVSAGYYKVEITNANGCKNISDSVQFISCSQLFSVQTIPDTSICEGNPVHFITSSGGQGNCSWSGPGGLSSYTICNPVFTAPSAGDFLFIISDQLNGCSNSDTVNIHADPLPPKPLIYQSGDTLLSDFAAAYQWYYNGSPLPGETVQFCIATLAGSYSVTVIDPKGCNNMSDAVNFNPCSLLIHVTASGDTAVCEGTVVTLSETGNGSGNCIWTGPAGLNDYLSCNPLFTASVAGQFTYIVSDTLSGCEATDTVVITVNSLPVKPVATIMADSLTSTPAASYQWYSIGQALPGENNRVLNPSQAGYYYVVVTNASGCTATSDSVNFSPCSMLLTVQSIADTSVCAGIPVTLVTTGNGAGNCVWNGPAGLDNYNTCEPVFISQTGGDYLFVVYDQLNGCIGSDSVAIHIFDLPVAPVVTQQNDSLISTSANAYQWYSTGMPLAFENSYFMIPDHPAYYFIEITDANGCKATSDSIYPVFTGIYENESSGSLDIKYIAANQYLIFTNASSKYDIVTVDIYDYAGRKIAGSQVRTRPGSDAKVLLPAFTSATCFVRITNSVNSAVKKFFRSDR